MRRGRDGEPIEDGYDEDAQPTLEDPDDQPAATAESRAAALNAIRASLDETSSRRTPEPLDDDERKRSLAIQRARTERARQLVARISQPDGTTIEVIGEGWTL